MNNIIAILLQAEQQFLDFKRMQNLEGMKNWKGIKNVYPSYILHILSNFEVFYFKIFFYHNFNQF